MSSSADGPAAFKGVVNRRRAVKKFDSARPLPQGLLQDLMHAAARAPTSFNIQPWKCIFVTDQARKEALAPSMSGANADRVLQAPCTAVFLSDLEAFRLTPRLMDLARKSGAGQAYIASLPANVAFLTAGGEAGRTVKNCAVSAASPLASLPSVNAPQAWAFKNTMPAAQSLMLAAAAAGVDTSPMEGFVEAGVRAALDVPERYSVPVVIGIGYAAEDDWVTTSPPSARFSTSQLFCLDSFHKPAPEE